MQALSPGQGRDRWRLQDDGQNERQDYQSDGASCACAT